MKILTIVFYGLIIFTSCNPCEKYKNEIYEKNSFAGNNFDSLGMVRMKLRLIDFNEPAMDTINYESYRLTHSLTFEDTVHIIRIENDHSNYRFIHKKLLKNHQASASIIETIEKKLFPDEWEKFKTVLYQNHYWIMPKEIDRYGLDGAVLTIEGRRPNAEICGKRSYHLVSRWSPEKGEFQNLCHKFYEIIGEKE